MSEKKRLLSVDALRGFDMFWIMGAEGLFLALHLILGWQWLIGFDTQMAHAEWHGFTAYDLIFPLFIFLSGVSIGLAAKPFNQYPSVQQRGLLRHAFKRLGLLILLGILYNHGWGVGVPANFDDIRFASVLARIGIAWFFAILMVWFLTERQQWVTCVVILLGYWLALSFLTIGEYGGSYTPTVAINVWFDQTFLPGATYRNAPLDPEGILSNLPSIVNAMAGVFIGRLIKSKQSAPYQLLNQLLIVGFVTVASALIWHQFFPINKTLWSSSFTLLTVGLSIWLLAIFYLVIDVWKIQKWAVFFSVIGMNSIVIYLSTSLVQWQYVAKSVFGGLIAVAPEQWHSLLSICFLLCCQWLVLYWLYKRKIFIKV